MGHTTNTGVSRIWTYLNPQWIVLSALTLLGGVAFIAWRLRRLFLGECRRDPKHFLSRRRAWTHLNLWTRLMPHSPAWKDRGQIPFINKPTTRIYAWNHLKKGLVPHSSGCWDGGQIPLINKLILSRLIFGLIWLHLAIQHFDSSLFLLSCLVYCLSLIVVRFMYVFVTAGYWCWINTLSTRFSLCINHLDNTAFRNWSL